MYRERTETFWFRYLTGVNIPKYLGDMPKDFHVGRNFTKPDSQWHVSDNWNRVMMHFDTEREAEDFAQRNQDRQNEWYAEQDRNRLKRIDQVMVVLLVLMCAGIGLQIFGLVYR